MIFPEHMEFRYYITPERKECYELYSMTLGCRRTLLEKTQDLGQCLVDLYDTDFYDTYCVLSEINKLLRPLTPEHKDETAWRKLLELAMPLCKVHPFFGLLIKELSDLAQKNRKLSEKITHMARMIPGIYCFGLTEILKISLVMQRH